MAVKPIPFDSNMIPPRDPMHSGFGFAGSGRIQNSSLLGKAGVTIIFVIVSLQLTFLILADTTVLVSTLPDDAFYYLQVAKNMAMGHGSTFDGIHETNGYHPLWQVLLVPIFFFQLTPVVAVRVALLFQLTIATASIFAFRRMVLRFRKPGLAFIAILLWFPLVFLRTFNGMETSLAIFFLILSSRLLMIPEGPCAARRSFVLGLMLSLLMLSRLDMCFFVLPAGLHHIFSCRKKSNSNSLQSIVPLGAAFLLLFLPYLATNYIFFNELLPISGIIKTSFPHLAGNTIRSFTGTNQFPLFNLLIIAAACAYLVWVYGLGSPALRHLPPEYKKLLSILAIMTVTHSAYTFCFVRWGIFGWYFVPYGVFAVLLAAPVVNRLLEKSGPFSKVFAYGTYVLLLVATLWRMQSIWSMHAKYTFASYNLAAVQWATAHTRPADIFAYTDCGIFSFFSDRRVINLDGLMNNRDYQKVLHGKGLTKYLEANGVAYLLLYDRHPTQFYARVRETHYAISYVSQLFGTMSDSIQLDESDKRFRIFRESVPDRKIITIFELPYDATGK